MSSAPAVSIVIPAYNVAPYLAETLESVRRQDFADFEVIVIDDGSRDATAQVAEELAATDSRIRVVRQTNQGVSAARNRGVAESKADLIAFLDGDDTWEPGALGALVGAIENNPDAVGAHGQSRYVDEQGQPFSTNSLDFPRRYVSGARRIVCAPEEPTTFAVLAFLCPITIGAILVRRAAVLRAGGFDERMKYSEDWDLWQRMSLRGDFAFVPRLLLNYRKREGSAMHKIRPNKYALYKQDYDVRAKLIDRPELTEEQRLLARRSQPVWFHLWRAGVSLRRGSMLAAARDVRLACDNYFTFHARA